MTIPDYQAFMRPLLQSMSEGKTSVASCIPGLIAHFHLSSDEAAELLPSGKKTYVQDRAHWARTYLSKAGLLTSPARNVHVATEAGKAFLASHAGPITTTELKGIPQFASWWAASLGQSEQEPVSSPPEKISEQTPEGMIEASYKVLDSALRGELLQAVLSLSPQRFERLILDLLSAMGFGGGRPESANLTKASGDGGIDGVVHEDALGLDAVYIQAKRWAPEHSVGSPELQKFVGSLHGESANKGVFVTTSSFSAAAKAYLNKVQQRIVLIDGQELARLMVQFGVGVRSRATYVLHGVDEDYFSDDAH